MVIKGHLACHCGDIWPPIRIWGRDLHHWTAKKGLMDRTLGGVKGLKKEKFHCEGAKHMAGKILCSLFSSFSLLLYFWEGLINLPKLWKVRSCFSHAPLSLQMRCWTTEAQPWICWKKKLLWIVSIFLCSFLMLRSSAEMLQRAFERKIIG